MTHASVDPTILQTYFAQGQFIDIYRFRYTVTNFTPRTLHFATLNLGGTSFNDPLSFRIFADAGFSDFVGGTDPNNPANTITTPAGQVDPTILQGSFNQFANQVAQGPGGGVPLPGGLWTGAVSAAIVLALRRRLALAIAR